MFREKIKGKMNEAGISVKDLAAKTKINPSTISSFLVGNRAISTKKCTFRFSKLHFSFCRL